MTSSMLHSGLLGALADVSDLHADQIVSHADVSRELADLGGLHADLTGLHADVTGPHADLCARDRWPQQRAHRPPRLCPRAVR
jgi:hypothetical protein